MLARFLIAAALVGGTAATASAKCAWTLDTVDPRGPKGR